MVDPLALEQGIQLDEVEVVQVEVEVEKELGERRVDRNCHKSR
jgi:hypothetical protein